MGRDFVGHGGDFRFYTKSSEPLEDVGPEELRRLLGPPGSLASGWPWRLWHDSAPEDPPVTMSTLPVAPSSPLIPLVPGAPHDQAPSTLLNQPLSQRVQSASPWPGLGCAPH